MNIKLVVLLILVGTSTISGLSTPSISSTYAQTENDIVDLKDFEKYYKDNKEQNVAVANVDSNDYSGYDDYTSNQYSNDYYNGGYNDYQQDQYKSESGENVYYGDTHGSSSNTYTNDARGVEGGGYDDVSYYEYGDGYDKYPPKPDKPKKFTCPDTGLIVDEEGNCPLVCPVGSLLEGHLVVPGSDLDLVCNLEFPEIEICAEGTQLEGLLVSDTNGINDGNELACNPFELCPEGTALEGVAVIDDGNPETPLPDALCTQNGLEKCPANTDLEGVFAMGDGDLTTTAPQDTMLAENCDLEDRPGDLVCPAGTALEGIQVSDLEFCNLHGLDKCPMDSDLPGAFVMDTDGNTVFDNITPDTTEPVCNLPDNEVCPEGTDLPGVVVQDITTDCDLQQCPPGTALEGVFIQANSPDVEPPPMGDGIPDVCVLKGLEKCPPGTVFEGFFVMGDGNMDTTVPEDEMLTEICIPEAQLTVTKETTCDVEEFGQEFCASLDAEITVTGNNPNPSFFFESSTPQVVSIGPGDYSVQEDGFVEGLEPCSTMGFDGGRDLGNGLFLCTNFSEDCQGEIMAGEMLTCDIANTVVDGDDQGDLDIVIAHNNADVNGENDNVHARLGNGIGTFGPPTGTSPPDWEVGDEAKSVALADFNNDGNLDFVTANFNSETITVRLGNGDGTFGPIITTVLANADGPRFVAVGLFNDDNIPDVAVAMYNQDDVKILLGDGDGTFTAAPDVPVGDLPRSIALADFDGDGELDMAVANEGDDTVSILLGDGDGTFTPATPATVTVGVQPFSVVVGFFDAGNVPDLAVANSNADDVSILLGDGDGTFTAAADVPVGDEPHSVTVGNFNNDANQDIAVANFGSDSVSIRLGNGDGTFALTTTFALTSGDDPTFIVAADFNGDGFDDLAVANMSTDHVAILLNNGDGTGTMYTRSNLPSGEDFEPTSIAVGFID